MRAALRPFDLPADARVTLAFVDDATMRALNARHRRKDRTTDVLAFGQGLPAGAKGAGAVPHLARDADGSLDVGDIAISGPRAERQARRRGVRVEREVAFLAAHGGLHLLGYEDDTPAGHREMVRLGEAALRAARSRRPARPTIR
ncbi:MAG: rRNA maturation RNase YbeY [Candidatus Limnocylindria bacterium]